MKMSGRRGMRVMVAAAFLVTMPAFAFGANKLVVKGTDGTTDKFVVTDGGRVGVGTSVPDAGIHLKGNAYPNTAIKVQYEGTTPGGGGGFLLYHNNAGAALPLINDRLGYLFFGSQAGATIYHAAGLEAKAEGGWTSSSTPAYFSFATTPSGSLSRTERMRITGAGNIGVGTTSPTQKLEVSGGVRLNASTSKPVCDSNSRGTLWFAKGGVGVADTLEVCAKDASENYAWRNTF